jgi:hypothetical protein
MTLLSRQAKDLSVQYVDHKQDRAESTQSNWAIRVLHELNTKKVKFKATHGNLINLLDLDKSNRADN